MIRTQLIAAGLLTGLIGVAQAQSSSQPKSPPSRSPSKSSKPAANGPQVDVEILFLEVTSVTGKQPMPKLTGSSEQVNKAIADLKKGGRLKTLNRVSLSALDGQKAMTQLGATQSTVTSFADPNFGRRGGRVVRSHSSRSYGTLVTLTPTVEEAGTIVLQTQFEKSWLKGGHDGGTEAGETTIPASLATVTVNSTLRVRSGEFAVLSSTGSTSKTGTDRVVVLVSAVLKDGGGAARQELKIFKLVNADAESVAKTLEQFLPKGQISVVADKRTNSVIVKGPATALRVVEALLQKLDEQP